MPCRKGMTGCAATCAHRRFVQDYYRDRDAQLVRAEAATNGYETELAAYFGDDGAGDAVEERWTFQRQLNHYQGADYPYPRADRNDDGAYDADPAGEVGEPADR